MLSRNSTTLASRFRRGLSSSLQNYITPIKTPPSLNVSNRFQLQQSMMMSTVQEDYDATDAWKKSCYYKIDYTIHQDATVYDAVQRFAAFDIGCLVVVDDNGDIAGVISERDYICKIALLGRTSKETKVKEISTKTANLVTATPEDNLDVCMSKMLSKEIRHLPILDGDDKVCGMISVKDLVKSIVADRERTIEMLSNFALGKGGHFSD